jgi:hypothetical protein
MALTPEQAEIWLELIEAGTIERFAVIALPLQDWLSLEGWMNDVPKALAEREAVIRYYRSP